jgi:hypothetical protein
MWSIPLMNVVAVAFPPHFHELPPPQLDALMLFGFLCALATLLCYMEQSRSRSFILAFAVCSALLAGFAFMKDAWPVGIVEAVWSSAAVWRWWAAGNYALRRWKKPPLNPWQTESRIDHLFGHEIQSN